MKAVRKRVQSERKKQKKEVCCVERVRVRERRGVEWDKGCLTGKRRSCYRGEEGKEGSKSRL